MYRLRISLIVAVLVSVIGTGWLADQLFGRWVSNDMEPAHLLQVRGQTLVALIENGILSTAAVQTLIEDAIQLPSDSLTSDENGSVKEIKLLEAVGLIGISDLPLPASLRDQLLAGEELLLESDDRLHWYQRVGSSDEILSISRNGLPDPGRSMQWVFTLLFYACVAGLILAWVYPLTRQLKRLGIAAESLGKGDLSRRVPTRAGNSLRGLETQFNRMAQRLQLLVEDNKLLCGAVSHDLRTPLARLRFGIDALHEKLLDVDSIDTSRQKDVQRFLGRINDDLLLMESLVSTLLEFARLDQTLQDIPKVPIRLGEVIRDQCQLPSLYSKDVQHLIETHHDIVLGDERYARMLLSNLVENAIRFARQRVVISLRKDAGQLVLSIEDDGIGFESGSREQLLKPFSRGGGILDPDEEDQLALAGKGYGLGLAIVERLSQWFGARLTLGSSVELGGARVVVFFEPHQE